MSRQPFLNHELLLSTPARDSVSYYWDLDPCYRIAPAHPRRAPWCPTDTQNPQ
jgi:hypothetical protein